MLKYRWKSMPMTGGLSLSGGKLIQHDMNVSQPNGKIIFDTKDELMKGFFV